MISVKADLKEIERNLSDIERRQLPFASRLALKNTANHIARKTIPAILPSIFDRPTRWTLQGFYAYQPPGRQLLEAYVNIKDGGSNQPGRGGKVGTPAFQFLKPHIDGRNRNAKSHEKKLRRMGILGNDEYTVPGDEMRLNRFGNLTGATYSKILADVQGSDRGIAQGYGQATTKRGKKRYFYHPNLRPRGIYIRTGRRTLKVALLFVKTPRYENRFDFEGISRRVAVKQFPIEFRKAMARALATAKR